MPNELSVAWLHLLVAVHWSLQLRPREADLIFSTKSSLSCDGAKRGLTSPKSDMRLKNMQVAHCFREGQVLCERYHWSRAGNAWESWWDIQKTEVIM
jgi:hypothetical protein